MDMKGQAVPQKPPSLTFPIHDTTVVPGGEVRRLTLPSAPSSLLSLSRHRPCAQALGAMKRSLGESFARLPGCSPNSAGHGFGASAQGQFADMDMSPRTQSSSLSVLPPVKHPKIFHPQAARLVLHPGSGKCFAGIL